MVKIFTFVKNEEYLMRTWLPYHINIFGKENIYVIDHDSTDGTKDLIRQSGVNFFEYTGSFDNKSNVISQVMHTQKDKCAFLVPVDADEFICLYKNGEVVIDGIMDEFKTLPRNNLKYKFSCMLVHNDKDDYEDPLKEMVTYAYDGKDQVGNRAKTFYPSNLFLGTDQGNHHGHIQGENNRYNFGNLCLLHYEIRGFTHYKEKNIKGAKAYGIDKGRNSGCGTHWGKRFGFIKSQPDEGLQEFRNEFQKGRRGNIESKVFSEYIDTLER